MSARILNKKTDYSRNLEISNQPIDILQPYKGNARTHSEKQINQIANSIAEFGFTNPILIDENNTIIAGHGRVLAAKKLSVGMVPTVCIDDMTDAQKRAYIIADNKLAENAGWDPEILAIEFQYFSEIELDFDMEVTGFETAEIDILLHDDHIDEDPLDQLPISEPDKPAITKTGDVWVLGNHRIVCGDCRDEKVMATLMQDSKAQMTFMDPPYNVKVDGHVCGSGNIKHREFAMASGEMSVAEFTDFLSQVFKVAVDNSSDGSIHDICMDWRHMPELLKAGERAGYELKNLCVWVKNNGGMGSFYRSRHELVAVFKSGKAKHINNIQLGKHGRYRTNVWEYPGVNSFGGVNDLAMHPTVKPCALVMDAIKDCSKLKGIILDTFGGSGTTLIAAEKTGRHARLVEIDPHYVDVTVRRWQDLTGLKAVLEATGQAFGEVEAQASQDEGDVS